MEKIENKRIKCSYALLVIIMFAALAIMLIFNISSDVSLCILSETKTLINNNNNSIVDSNAPFSDITGTN